MPNYIGTSIAGLMLLIAGTGSPSDVIAAPGPKPTEYLTIEEAEAARRTPEAEEDVNEEVDVHIMNGHHFEQFSRLDQESIVKYLITENIARLPGYDKATTVERKKLLNHWTSASAVAGVTMVVVGKYQSGKTKKAVYVVTLVQKQLQRAKAKGRP